MRGLLRNLLLAAVVFLPLFLLMNVAELRIRGIVLSDFWYQLSGAVVIYLGLLLPVLLGAIVHTASSFLIPSRVAVCTWRIAIVALAPLLPLTVIVSGLAPYLSDYPGSTAVATFAYGLLCAHSINNHKGAES